MPWTSTRPEGRRRLGLTYRSAARGGAPAGPSIKRTTGAWVIAESGRQRAAERNSIRNAVEVTSVKAERRGGRAKRTATSSQTARDSQPLLVIHTPDEAPA